MTNLLQEGTIVSLVLDPDDDGWNNELYGHWPCNEAGVPYHGTILELIRESERSHISRQYHFLYKVLVNDQVITAWDIAMFVEPNQLFGWFKTCIMVYFDH